MVDEEKWPYSPLVIAILSFLLKHQVHNFKVLVRGICKILRVEAGQN